MSASPDLSHNEVRIVHLILSKKSDEQMNILVYLTRLLRRLKNVSLISLLLDSEEFGNLISSSLTSPDNDIIFSGYEILYQIFKKSRILEYRPNSKWKFQHSIELIISRLRNNFLAFALIPALLEYFKFWKYSKHLHKMASSKWTKVMISIR